MSLTLHIAEGEKCADALAELGFIATTSQGGSGAPHKTDWAPAALFERVFIWQDVDATNPESGVNPGVKYAETVAKLILEAKKERGQKSEVGGQQQQPLTDVRGSDIQPEIFIVDLRAYWMAQQHGAEYCSVAPGTPDGAEFNGRDVFDLIEELKQDGKTNEEMAAGLMAIAEQYSRFAGATVAVVYPNQPAPLGVAPEGPAERKEIENWAWGDVGDKKLPCAVSIDQVRASVKAAAGEWPCRICAPGAQDPLLFVDTGMGRVRWLGKSAGFEAFLHERGRLSFCEGQDKRFKNFVSNGSLYHSFGGSELVREYKAIEYYPHEPLMPGHYYTWRPPAGYRPDGRRLHELLKFFTNMETPETQLLFAAVLCTPFWGGPYKERPAFIFTAPDKNCGKTTAATIVGKLCGGHVAIALDAKQEAQIKERLLSPSALSKRVVLADNIKRAMDSAVLEELITTEEISGKRLYYGEATRPNNITYLATANMPTISRDLVLRAFFVSMTKPNKDSDWSRALNKFMARHAEEVVCDILRLLRGKPKYKKLKPPADERFPLWVDEVLNRVMGDEAVAAAVGAVDDQKLLQINEEKRIEHDEDRKQAQMLWDGLLPLICEENEWVSGAGTTGCLVKFRPQGRVTMMAAELKHYWAKIFGREVNNSWLAMKMKEHMSAGRLSAIEHGVSRRGSEYYIPAKVVNDYLESCEREREEMIAGKGDQAVAVVAADAARESGHQGGAQ